MTPAPLPASLLAPFTLFAVLADCAGPSNATAVSTAIGDDASTVDDVSTEGGRDRAPITGLASETWTWVPFPSSQCRDGSSTGIGVNLSPTSDRLLIFEEGGGACFNAESCSGNPSSFASSSFAALANAQCGERLGHACTSINDGIFDRTQVANPARDWSYVFVPYCTGDVHAGNRRNVAVPGVIDGDGATAVQQFVGYANLEIYLRRVAPTFPTVSRVTLAGVSAGGFGVVNTYSLVARAFANVPVDMIDDSGPPMEDPYLATCQQTEEARLWGLDGTILADCGTDCTAPSSVLLDYAQHLVRAHPQSAFGLVASTADDTTTNEFGFGYDDCAGFRPLSAEQSYAGLLDIRSKLASYANFGAFLFPGNAHTSLQNGTFYSRVAGGGADGGTGSDASIDGGIRLTDWMARIALGQAANVGP